MSESEVLGTEEATAAASSPQEKAKDLCQGLWRLKPDVVLRVEEDGAILFDPDTDGLTVVNLTGSALLQWRRDRICYEELCDALYTHYREHAELTQIRADVKEFLEGISYFVEPNDDTGE